MTSRSHNSIVDFIAAQYILAPGAILSLLSGLAGMLFAFWELGRRSRPQLKASVLGLLLNLGLMMFFGSQMRIGNRIGDYGFETANPVILHLFVAFYGPNAKDSFGRTPLFRSIVFNNRDSAAFLLKHGAEVKGKRPSDDLHEAAKRDQPEMVELFLENGADPWVRDSSGRFALDFARSREVKAVFLRRGIKARATPQTTASSTWTTYYNIQDFLDSLKKNRGAPGNSQ